MYFNMSIIEQFCNIIKNNLYLLNQKCHFSNDISDVVDGFIYKNFTKSELENCIDKDKEIILSFIINTDGISISDKSNITIWPIYLAINEIPKSTRFCINNMIIAGITIGDKKPNFEIFMEPIVNELKKLEMGIIYDQQTKIKCFTLFGVYE